ncbi:DNA topoisomerase III, partial [human gut metagenome]
MEDAAIREGFANLRPDSDYDALYQSALCRAKADWLVGINATRLFSMNGSCGCSREDENEREIFRFARKRGIS